MQRRSPEPSRLHARPWVQNLDAQSLSFSDLYGYAPMLIYAVEHRLILAFARFCHSHLIDNTSAHRTRHLDDLTSTTFKHLTVLSISAKYDIILQSIIVKSRQSTNDSPTLPQSHVLSSVHFSGGLEAATCRVDLLGSYIDYTILHSMAAGQVIHRG